MSVTLLDVWRAARARSVPFSGESAGFVALSLCEATQHSPRSLGLTDAELGEDGALRPTTQRACEPQQADKELRTLLGRLLEVASSPGPSLFRAASRGGGASLPLLAEEIEKALIPLNRAAARRALVRLFRETARAVQQGKLGPAPDLDEPAQIRLSPPPPAVAPASPAPKQVPLTPPPAVVSAVTPPPLPPVVTVLTPPPLPPVRVVSAVTPPPAPVASPLPPPFIVEPPVEPDQLTSPQTIVARRARGIKSAPPPLPPAERTPRIGSVDVAVISVPRIQAAPFTDVLADATERVPPVAEIEEEAGAEPCELDAQLQALAEWPLAAKVSVSVPVVAEVALVAETPAEIVYSPDPPTAEPPALRESPALVVGVDVADSDEHAEAVADDELETRPLPSSVSALPVEPIRPMLAPESDVRELVAEFQVRDGLSETELRRELSALAGVDLTPGSAVEVGPR